MRVFSNGKLHPDIFNIINYNNLPESDNRRKFAIQYTAGLVRKSLS